MITDSLFHTERNPLRKIAMLLTIPCAILLIMVASAGVMSIPFKPLFFENDFVLFGIVYLLYGYGLFLSFKVHRNLMPFLFFISHIAVILIYIFQRQAAWIGYVSIISIMLTSVSNQYYRTGSIECKDCAAGNRQAN